jgi:prephenate dehydrogenase
MPTQRLSILGVGLLGGSIGLALRAVGSSVHITGYGHRPATLEKALEVGAIDRSAITCKEAVRGADLVILCTPVGLFEPILTEAAGALADGVIVTDVGSTKRSVVDLARRILPKSARFVGSHPMAGSEKRGIEFARADLFQGAHCIITPTDETDPSATEQVEDFWKLLGMRTTRMPPDIHDRLVCDVSHLPHAIAAALVAMQSEEALSLAGKGFLDATRIAGGDGALWRDILHDNRDNLVSSLDRLRGTLDHLVRLLDPSRREELAKWLDAAADRRAKLLAEKLRELD